jgi:hypothetical protein
MNSDKGDELSIASAIYIVLASKQKKKTKNTKMVDYNFI